MTTEHPRFVSDWELPEEIVERQLSNTGALNDISLYHCIDVWNGHSCAGCESNQTPVTTDLKIPLMSEGGVTREIPEVLLLSGVVGIICDCIEDETVPRIFPDSQSLISHFLNDELKRYGRKIDPDLDWHSSVRRPIAQEELQRIARERDFKRKKQ